MNPDLNTLHPYPFEKLAKIKAGLTPPAELKHIALSIGEPKHPTPPLIAETLIENISGLGSYPLTKGDLSLRKAICDWLGQRFHIAADHLDPEHHALPVNGTREALFAIAQAVVERRVDALVLMPNPFYQIYEGAAILAGATPYYLNTTEENNFLPDLDAVPESVWQRCQLIYLCSPSNPTGSVIGEAMLKRLIELADKYDFIVASDECYSEIYFDEAKPPTGLLEVAEKMGREDFSRCLVFHSLSKRSNAPGLRSGFVAGDAEVLKKFFLYRTYHGCSMPPPTQAASIKAWGDEKHVKENRDQYREKFAAVIEILSPVIEVKKPDAGFYLWLKTPISDVEFAARLFAEQNITVLPGSYLSRETEYGNPGENYVRIALVASTQECVEAAHRIHNLITSL